MLVEVGNVKARRMLPCAWRIAADTSVETPASIRSSITLVHLFVVSPASGEAAPRIVSGWSDERAPTYLQSESGKSFDPRAVDEFLRLIASQKSETGRD